MQFHYTLLVSIFCVSSFVFPIQGNAGEDAADLFKNIFLQTKDIDKYGKVMKNTYGVNRGKLFEEDDGGFMIGITTQNIELESVDDSSLKIKIRVDYEILKNDNEARIWCFSRAANTATGSLAIHSSIRKSLGLLWDEFAFKKPGYGWLNESVDSCFGFQCKNVVVFIHISNNQSRGDVRSVAQNLSQPIIERIRKSKELEKIRKGDYSFLPKEVQERLKKEE